MSDPSKTVAGQANKDHSIHEVSLGETIDGFFVKDLLCERSVCNLYWVSHPKYDLPMVMKVPKLGVLVPPDAFAGFETETRILSRLHGIYTPKVIAKGDLATCPYIVMEYIEGDALQQAVKQAPIPVEQLCELMIPVSKAVHELHKHSIIHLDLKPENFRNRGDGATVILDFGTAHHTHMPDMYEGGHEKAPRTLDYVAPEQLHDIRNDSRSDIFALGVIMYQLATGKLPFNRANPLTVRNRLHVPAIPPRSIRANVPPWLQEIILRCLQRRPDDRLGSAKQLAYSLTHPNMVSLSRLSQLKRKPSVVQMASSWLTSMTDDFQVNLQLHPHERVMSVPHVLVAVDPDHASEELKQALHNTVLRLAEYQKNSFFTVISIIEQNELSNVEDVDQFATSEHPTHIHRQIELRHWMKSLGLAKSRVNYQVFNGHAAKEIVRYARHHVVDHIVIGARGSSTLRRFMGSVSSKVVAEAPCTVTVVRSFRDHQEH